MRRTKQLVKVAAVLMSEPEAQHYGYDLSRRAGVRSGVLYPILTRLLNAGWLADGWEDPNTIAEHRPPRRYYTITDKGRAELNALATTEENRS